MLNFVEDDIGRVVELMRLDPNVTALGFDGAPFYMFGHRLEIANRLKAKSTSADQIAKRYPLIALKLDNPSPVEGDVVKYNLNIAILHSTNSNYNAEQRLTNVVKPILNVLYISFFQNLKKSGRFIWDQKLLTYPPHVRIVRYFYGTGTEEQNIKNIFSDPLDGIELVDLKINSVIKTC